MLVCIASALMEGLSIIGLVCLLIGWCGVILHGIALGRLRLHLQKAPWEGERVAGPVTHWRAIKKGVPALAAKLESLILSTRKGDQVLLGADEGSLDAEICTTVKHKFPKHDIVLVLCKPGIAINPKISKFIQMQPQASHTLWMLTDSEAILEADFVDRVLQEWSEGDVDAITCGYRFEKLIGWFQKLDATAALATLWPGLMLAKNRKFTLGACTLLAGDDVKAAGGWEAFGGFLAEDCELGKALVRAGKKIGLSRYVLSLEADPMTLIQYAKHQHRVAVTYRVADISGAAGLPFMHVIPALVVAVFLLPKYLAILASVGVFVRLAQVQTSARLLRWENPGLWFSALIGPVMESFFWLLAWLPLPVWWTGRWLGVGYDGRLGRTKNLQDGQS